MGLASSASLVQINAIETSSARTLSSLAVSARVRQCASLRSMTAVWMGHSTLQREIDAGAIELIGDKALARRMHEWLGLSSFAKEKQRAAN
jgi:hypothetical protein